MPNDSVNQNSKEFTNMSRPLQYIVKLQFQWCSHVQTMKYACDVLISSFELFFQFSDVNRSTLEFASNIHQHSYLCTAQLMLLNLML